jgi:uncharacterized protein
MLTHQHIIDQTKKWITNVVIASNFCPFAANVMKKRLVHYSVETSALQHKCLNAILLEIYRLDNENDIDTSFLIFPNCFAKFEDYLRMVSKAEKILTRHGYDGIYQFAGFHPLYLFENSTNADAANYTNRSLYPMLHLLREKSIDKALEQYALPGNIPETNINFANNKGLTYMQLLRDNCF